jgi:hypothetical protein
MTARGLSDVRGAARAKEVETFSADRRWVLGPRRQPLRLERILKFDRRSETLTHFAQSGPYSIHIYDKTKGIFTFRAERAGAKDQQREFRLPNPIDKISVCSCCLGYFYLSGEASRDKVKSFFVNVRGELKEVSSDHFSRSAFYWYEDGPFLCLLVTSTFGHIFRFRLSGPPTYEIVRDQLHHDRMKRFLFSLTAVMFNGLRHIVVGGDELLVFAAGESGPREVKSHKVIGGSNFGFPSYVVSNGTHVAWLNVAELRILTFAQLFDDGRPGISLPVERLGELGVGLPEILPREEAPLVMSQYYVILCAPTAIVGYYLEDSSGGVAFRFPFSGEILTMPLAYIEADRVVFVANAQGLYRIDLTTEQPPLYTKTLQELKDDTVRNLTPGRDPATEDLKRAELLTTFLESGRFDSAVDLLTTHLQALEQRARARVGGIPVEIDQERVKRICEEFLIFELQIVDACQRNQPAEFNPVFYVETAEADIDIFAALAKILHLRAFSKISEKVREIAKMPIARKSPLVVRLLMEDKSIHEAIDIILEFGQSPSARAAIIWNYRSYLSGTFQMSKYKPQRDFILSILPYVTTDLPPTSAKTLIQAALAEKDFHFVDQLVWAIALSPRARDFDRELFEQFSRLPEARELFVNPLSTFERCNAAEMFFLSSWIAHIVGRHLQAVKIAKRVDLHIAQRYVHHAPREIRAELCRAADIEYEHEEGEEMVRCKTKEAVTRELQSMIAELEALGRQGKASADFLKELEEWGTAESEEEGFCGICRRRLTGTSGYRFPCGHCFHKDCLIEAARPLVGEAEREIIDAKGKDSEAAERIFAEDCPLCGMLSVNRIRHCVLPIDRPPLWGLDASDLVAPDRAPKKQGRFPWDLKV